MQVLPLNTRRSLIQSAKICWIIIAIGLGSVLPTKAVEQDSNSSHSKRQGLNWERYRQELVLEKLARSHEKRTNLSTALEGEGSLYADETASRLPVAKNDSRGVAVGDADGDGDLDIIIANQPNRDSEGNLIPGSGQNKLLMNDSTGKFVDETTTRLPVDDFRTFDVEFGDIDSDGDLDIFATNGRIQPSQLLTNDGTGVFSDETATRLPEEKSDTSDGRDAELGDLDGDGDLDIVVANGFSQRSRLLINDGSGKYSDETESRLPLDSEKSQDLDIGDIDNDGDLDIVVANGLAPEAEQNRLFTNNSKGVFEDETSVRLPALLDKSKGVILVDVDGDKDLDVFFANSIEESRLYINDGTGKFSDETANRLPVGTDFNQDVSIGDVDNDGDFDLFVADVGQDELLINDGVGIYTVGEFPDESDFGSDAEFADVNSDGNLDLFVTNIAVGDINPPNRLYINTRAPLHLPVDPQNTLVEAAPETIPADGNSISTITVTPKDAMGNNLGKDQRVVLRSSAGTLLGTVSDKGDGTYTQELQASSTPETAVITTFTNGVKIARSTQIVFTE